MTVRAIKATIILLTGLCLLINDLALGNDDTDQATLPKILQGPTTNQPKSAPEQPSEARHKTKAPSKSTKDSSPPEKRFPSQQNTNEPSKGIRNRALQNDQGYRTIFNEDFKSNENNWLTKDDKDALIVLQNNSYYFEHKNTDGQWWISMPIGFRPDEDFIISTEITKSSGTLDYGYGIALGFNKEPRHGLFITLSGNGKYKTSKVIEGKASIVSDWVRCEHITPGNGATNTITLQRNGSNLSIFFNGKHTTTIPYETSRYGKISFFIYSNQAITIKNIVYKTKL